MNPNVKGRELESAVHAIEAVILASAPGLREESFTIEARKRINVGGVGREASCVESGIGPHAAFEDSGRYSSRALLRAGIPLLHSLKRISPG